MVSVFRCNVKRAVLKISRRKKKYYKLHFSCETLAKYSSIGNKRVTAGRGTVTVTVQLTATLSLARKGDFR